MLLKSIKGNRLFYLDNFISQNTTIQVEEKPFNMDSDKQKQLCGCAIQKIPEISAYGWATLSYTYVYITFKIIIILLKTY